MRRYSQRGRAYCFILFFILLVFVYFRDQRPPTDYIPHRSSSWCPVGPPRVHYVPKDSPRFNWGDLPTKYPVASLKSLPKPRTGKLPRIQHKFKTESKEIAIIRKKRQAEVKNVFLRSWKSYKEKAWKTDELAPISGGFKMPFGGWGATLVDSLDTLLIMGLEEDFEMAVTAVVDIDFGPESSSLAVINIFETTIRYLGGLLSAYDLTGCKDKRLLDKAVELGDMIYAAFDTPNRMPVNRWAPRLAAVGQEQLAPNSGIIAELGSFGVEFTRLSQLTGDMRFYDAISRITNVMDEQQNRTLIPGLWPVGANLQTLDLTQDSTFSLGAMSDSAYEYLPKMYALLGGGKEADQYRRMYDLAIETATNNILFRPMVPGDEDILMAGIAHTSYDGPSWQEPSGQHLACFVGGMYGLGGRLTRNETQVELGRKLTDGCIWSYRNSLTGIMPEDFRLFACPSLEACSWNETEWRMIAQPGRPFGFTEINDPRYLLRPEAIESVFILYRITGDPKYQEAAWTMFQAIEKYTRAEYGNAALHDVTVEKPEREDSMESFWMAETLKYFYLVFSEVDLISLDDFVFNTEAHPFRLRK